MATATALRSLRRADRHQLLYWALTLSCGFAALGAGSAAHLALAGNPNPYDMAWWVTLFVVAMPLAVSSFLWAQRLERDDPFAIWSPLRRVLFGTLAGCTAAVGLARLLTYVFQAISALVGVPGSEIQATDFAQVLVTLLITVPLFAWSLSQWRASNLLVRDLRRNTSQQ